MPATPHKRARNLPFFLLLLVSCALVSYLTAIWVMRQQTNSSPIENPHQWLHEELQLTNAESEKIHSFESAYQDQRQTLLTQFEAKKQALADKLRDPSTDKEAVSHAIHELHLVHGQLQELSIDHYYQMLEVLPPDKQTLLRNLAVEALSQPE